MAEEEIPEVVVQGDELFAEGVWHKGRVARYNAGRGSGFIECEVVKAATGKDVYVHGTVLARSGANVGDKVEFEIHLNTQGMPQAKAPLKILESGSGAAASYKGTVKSYSEKNGYGFVDCPELLAEYGRDVYLPSGQAQGCYAGQEVFFNILLNKDGMPMVSEVWPARIEEVTGGKSCGKSYCSAGGKPDGKPSGKFDGKGCCSGSSKGMVSCGGCGGCKGKDWTSGMCGGPPAQYYFGIVKSFNGKTGYGFVDCPELLAAYGRDVYLPRDKGDGWEIGQGVEFSIDLNKDGMPVAAEIWPSSYWPDAWTGAGASGKARQGGVKGGKVGGQSAKGGKVGGKSPITLLKIPSTRALLRPTGGCGEGSATVPAGGGGEGIATVGGGEEDSAAAVDLASIQDGSDAQVESAIAAADELFEQLVKEAEEAVNASSGEPSGQIENQAEGGEGDEGEWYTGLVKSYDMALGRGFLECEGIMATFGKDVYVHRNVLAKSGANVGDTVQFQIHINKQGMPQASYPLNVLSSEAMAHFKGKVKGFNDEKGYGFVECEETKEQFGRDVYLPGSKAKGCHSGQEVWFNVDLNKDGMPVIAQMWPVKIELAGPDENPKGKKGGKAGKTGKSGGKVFCVGLPSPKGVGKVWEDWGDGSQIEGSWEDGSWAAGPWVSKGYAGAGSFCKGGKGKVGSCNPSPKGRTVRLSDLQGGPAAKKLRSA